MLSINGNALDMCRDQFVLMDENCDGKVSKSEFWHFCDHFMTNAEISHSKTEKIWKAVNGEAAGPAPVFAQLHEGPVPAPAPGPAPISLVPLPDMSHMYITVEEFCTAGPKVPS